MSIIRISCPSPPPHSPPYIQDGLIQDTEGYLTHCDRWEGRDSSTFRSWYSCCHIMLQFVVGEFLAFSLICSRIQILLSINLPSLAGARWFWAQLQGTIVGYSWPQCSHSQPGFCRTAGSSHSWTPHYFSKPHQLHFRVCTIFQVLSTAHNCEECLGVLSRALILPKD